MNKICVLASGGDAPGMNAFFEAVYLSATAKDIECYASINGFNGLVDNDIVKMTAQNSTGISNRSGCVFNCGRCYSIMEHAGFTKALANIKKNGFSCVIVLGGNGSLIGTGRLKAAGVNVVFAPGTIDNDCPGTKHSLGFSSACEYSVECVDALRYTFETSKRDHIVQLMGRHCNELAIAIGTATFADIIDMDGARHTPEDVAKIFMANRKAGKQSSFMIMQERKSPDTVTDMIDSAKYLADVQKATNDNTVRMTTLGFLQRGAAPSCRDRYLGVMYGRACVDCVVKKQFGVGAFVTAGDTICYIDVERAPQP